MTISPISNQTGNQQADASQAIIRAIESIRYGSVEITIHDGQIAQIGCQKKSGLNGNGAISTLVWSYVD